MARAKLAAKGVGGAFHASCRSLLVEAGSALVSAGNLPILVEVQETGRRVYRWNYDPARSSLHRSPDWPILLSNLAELRRAQLPGPARTNLAAGESFEYRAGAPATYVLEEPGGERRELPARGTLVIEDLREPGFYRLFDAADSGDRALCRFGVTFADAAESDLRALDEGRHESEALLAQLEADSGWLETVLIVLAIALLAIDWLVLGRPAQAALSGTGAGARTGSLGGVG